MRVFGVVALELMLGLTALGCSRSDRASAPLASFEHVRSGPFVCVNGSCRQRQVRLPDDGEWRCAERDGVVWCAGGEPAAGVVKGPPDRGYRCGGRRGGTERVCVDAAPDYPDGGVSAYRCHFEGDFGVTRVCSSEPNHARPLPDRAPECWLDRDCGAGACDRGYCEARP